MSRMSMALGVVAALGLFSAEASAAVFPPAPPVPAAPLSETIVPGYSCVDVTFIPGNVSYVNNTIVGVLPTVIICPLPRAVTSSANASVTVVGSFNPFVSQCAVLSNNLVSNFAGVTSSTAVSIPVFPDTSLSVQCNNFTTGDIIKSIRVKS